MTVIFTHTCGVCGEPVRYREKTYKHVTRRLDHVVANVQYQQAKESA
jgi:hypothetical protein